MCLSFLRPLLILIYPIIFLVFIYVFKCKLTIYQVFLLIVIITISIISMFIEGVYFTHLLFSLYLVLSPLFLITLKPTTSKPFFPHGNFNQFFKVFSKVLTIVNVSAIFYALYVFSGAEYPDDVFTGLYGKSGFGSHSLSIMNMAVAVYYFQTKRIRLFVFYFICGILGFFGLGLIIFILTVLILSLPYLFKNIKIIIYGILISVLFVWVLSLVNPKNIDYILLNLKDTSKVFTSYTYEAEMEKSKNYKRTFTPRYFTFIDGAQQLFFSDLKVFVLGTSPGTFNSRTAFYLNGDFIQNKIVKDYFSKTTVYHDEYVLPLLNRKLISTIPWNDGTRNQPFSTIVSVFLEYGFFVGASYFIIFFGKIRKIKKETLFPEKKNYIKFLTIFMFLLFCVQNYLEYPEIILYFIIALKLLDIDNTNEYHFKENIST